ncbi:MAG TPA: biopolymer transporter ExbD [Abditibacteriaceae bacterium]|jgi:biopolymer transport protein ExbD
MAEINIIPLVDVVLVLLIIFMATTAFVKESGLNYKLPSAKTAEAKPENSQDINVALTRDGAIHLNGQPSDARRVETEFTTRARANPETRVIVKGDENIAYKRIIEVMDMAKRAGLPKVMLATNRADVG